MPDHRSGLNTDLASGAHNIKYYVGVFDLKSLQFLFFRLHVQVGFVVLDQTGNVVNAKDTYRLKRETRCGDATDWKPNRKLRPRQRSGSPPSVRRSNSPYYT